MLRPAVPGGSEVFISLQAQRLHDGWPMTKLTFSIADVFAEEKYAGNQLAAYLVRHRYFGASKIDTQSEQGYEIGRPSLLFLRAEDQGGTINVTVGGQVITVAKGELV